MSRYIDADKLEQRLRDFSDWCRDNRKDGVDFVLNGVLADTPDADVQEVRYGEWIESDYGICHCSECGFEYKSQAEVTQYCPVCGANMCGG